MMVYMLVLEESFTLKLFVPSPFDFDLVICDNHPNPNPNPPYVKGLFLGIPLGLGAHQEANNAHFSVVDILAFHTN